MNLLVTDGAAYDVPTIDDYGSLSKLTADIELSFGLVRSLAMLAVVSAPVVLPGSGSGGEAQLSAPSDLGSPDAVETLGDLDQGGSNGPGGGEGSQPDGSQGVAGAGGSGRTADGASGGGAIGSAGGGELPFTGLALAIIAGTGMMLSLAGTWLRQRLRRG